MAEKSSSPLLSLIISLKFSRDFVPKGAEVFVSFGTKSQENFKRMINDEKGELDFSAIVDFNK